MKTLKKKRDFEKIKQQGVKWTAPCFSILALSDFDQNYTGLIVSKKNLGKLAVKRNYAKRQMRELFYDAFKNGLLGKGVSYIAILKPPFATTDFSKKKEELAWSLKHIERLLDEKEKNN
ncbi:MAG: ribonuclease P protein component [Rickettsiales bacterium]|jgi:ribonuclease P protein component|nr:ribonuclease P protein component [Rickettsiales bacterium]